MYKNFLKIGHVYGLSINLQTQWSNSKCRNTFLNVETEAAYVLCNKHVNKEHEAKVKQKLRNI